MDSRQWEINTKKVKLDHVFHIVHKNHLQMDSLLKCEN